MRGQDVGKARLGRRYWRLWSASVVSNLGDGVGAIAFPWLVFTLPAGVITDRLDRSRIIGWADSARAALTAVIGGWSGGCGVPPLARGPGLGGRGAPCGATYGVLVGAVLSLTGMLGNLITVYLRRAIIPDILPGRVGSASLRRLEALTPRPLFPTR